MQQPSIKYGLLGAVVVVLYTLLIYVPNPNNMMHPGLAWISMVFYLFFMYKAAHEDCVAQGTDRDFREIIRTPFAVFLLINLGYWLFYYGLHLYDPSLLQAELLLEKNMLSTQLTAGVGDPEQANRIRERITAIDKEMLHPLPQPLGPIVSRMFVGAIGGFALAAGIAAVLRGKSTTQSNTTA
jgi:uncharacterized membrane-anchored protein YitT (DUF2179 family)